MDLTNLVQTVAKFAPLLGSVLPIPGGTAIGELIAHAFGGDISNPDDLASRIIGDPDAQVKLAEIEANTKVQLQQLKVLAAQNELAAHTAEIVSAQQDRADARKNNVAAKSKMPDILTFIIIVGFFWCFCFLIKYANIIPPNISSVLFMMVGTITTAFGGAFTYWLGDSVSSRNKDTAIHKTLDNLSGNNN